MRLLAGATLILVCGMLAGAASMPLPAPTGTLPIGTTTWHLVDKSRTEAFVAGATTREVVVHVWYPADPKKHTSPARYLRDGLAEARVFAKVLRRPENTFDDLATLATHAEFDRPIASGRFPFVMFSAGYTSVASAHTALLEDLASHGYIVANVVHPYEHAAATLIDGRVVTMLDDSGALRPEIQAVFAEWGKEDDAMAAVTRATTEDAQRAAVRTYLSGLKNTNIMSRRWVDDERFVVDAIRGKGDSQAATAAIASHIDLNRMVAAGHSMGGVAAGQFCAEEKLCRAALNFDGSPQYGPMIDHPMPKPILMVYSDRPGRAGANDAIYRPVSPEYYRVDVADTRHLDFADMTLWGGPLREVPALGSIDPIRVSNITRTIALEFFDQVLTGRRSRLLNGTASLPLPGVTIKRLTGPPR